MTTEDMEAARLVTKSVEGAPAREVPQRLCTALCATLGVDGATLSLLTDTPSRQMLAASDDTALLLEEIQFTVCEGPCVSAAATGEPVLVDDLRYALSPWPLFGASMREKLPQVTSVYAFPLYFGDYVLGSIDLLGLRSHTLDRSILAQASHAADAVAAALLPNRDLLITGREAPAWEPEEVVRAHWFDVRRAVGLVVSRRGLSPENALAVMRAKAFRTGRTLADITADILRQPPRTT
ncbi:GAF and ANTAR domain-containing protein [Streptomyces sp. BV286]|uniref:GAF and ANTAR domain-containing protein n=1 Tax=Streptomyces sp. BV286 TaxID=2849672 RepID=UPI001C2E5049|nr:GAF and ANTAR domain-containing protein [Streptomyces sp. BV286]MBV1939032.1 GAF and ANTAR domain-containing protein [Streptomyces sp. BV286]